VGQTKQIKLTKKPYNMVYPPLHGWRKRLEKLK
jgi:hypothetical protein